MNRQDLINRLVARKLAAGNGKRLCFDCYFWQPGHRPTPRK
jgi:hypothetical protein